MSTKIKAKVIHTNKPNIKKKRISPENNIDQINFKTQTPLFRIFMDNNRIKKVHLTRNTMNNSREENIKKMKIIYNKNIYYNPQIVSYKILEAKYNMTPALFSQKIIFNLVRNKRGHLLSYYHDTLLFDNSLKEFLKRNYKYKECLDKIPKYYNYYKNYLKFFCHPTFVDYLINKKMVKHMEKIAQVFYNRNYIPEVNNDEKKELNMVIFNKRVIKDIEKVPIISDDPTTKDNKILTKNNKNQNYTNLDMTPITTLTYGKNCPQVTKNSKYNYENIQNEEKNILLNSEYNIVNTNIENITRINETNNSLNTLIMELKESNKNNNVNKNNYILSEEERIKRYMESPTISPPNRINIDLLSPKNLNLKKSKKIGGFKYNNTNKIYLTSKHENIKMSNANQCNNNMAGENINSDNENQMDKKGSPILNKKMIKNLNININQLIINNKIITSVYDNARNREYNKLFYKNKSDNNQFMSEIKEILKIDKKTNNINLKSNNSNNFTSKDKNNKKIIDFKTTMHIGTSYKKIYPKLNRVNSMTRITPLSININEKKRNYSNLRDGRYTGSNTLLKLGGGILENQGKITLRSKNSILKKEKIITSDSNLNIFQNFNFTKVNTNRRGKIGTSNNISINNNKYNYIINSDKDIDSRRSLSNSKRTHKKIFKSGFNFNLSNDKLHINSGINSGINSPDNSIQKNKDNKDSNIKINNLKFNLHLKDINYLNNKEVPFIVRKKFGRKILGRKKVKEDQRLKLKNFDCIGGNEKRNFDIFSPKKNSFRKGPISLKSKLK